MRIYLTYVCVAGGVMHFRGEIHGLEPERDEDYKVKAKWKEIDQNEKKGEIIG